MKYYKLVVISPIFNNRIHTSVTNNEILLRLYIQQNYKSSSIVSIGNLRVEEISKDEFNSDDTVFRLKPFKSVNNENIEIVSTDYMKDMIDEFAYVLTNNASNRVFNKYTIWTLNSAIRGIFKESILELISKLYGRITIDTILYSTRVNEIMRLWMYSKSLNGERSHPNDILCIFRR